MGGPWLQLSNYENLYEISQKTTSNLATSFPQEILRPGPGLRVYLCIFAGGR